jgi:hypothetical protein
MKLTYKYPMKTNKFLKSILPNFLALITGNNLSWGFHRDEIVPKLNKACYVIGSVNKSFVSFEVLRMIYFSLVHSVISYGIIFGGTSSHIKIIFNIQKRIIRVITNSDSKESCNSPYIFSMLFFVKNRSLFKNRFWCSRCTRCNYDLHLSAVRLQYFKMKFVLW